MIQETAPYSPSQNGVAERSNRTLVELAWAMINTQQLSTFLCLHTVQHVAYLCNRAHTRALDNMTPLEGWTGEKLNISHLWEFGTPVWILHQGLHKGHKYEPKLWQKIFIGFDNGLKSVKYYNAETQKILTSRNYHFLTLSDLPNMQPILQFSILERWLNIFYLWLWSDRFWLITYDTITPSSVSFTVLYCGAQLAHSSFRLFFSWLLSFTDRDTLYLTYNL